MDSSQKRNWRSSQEQLRRRPTGLCSGTADGMAGKGQRTKQNDRPCTLEIQSVFLYVEGAEVPLNPRRSTSQEHFKGGRVILAPSLRVQSTLREVRQLLPCICTRVAARDGCWCLPPILICIRPRKKFKPRKLGSSHFESTHRHT